MITIGERGEVHLRCGAYEKRFTLTWTQRSILRHEDTQYMLVAGPPGTGKTTVLMCKGLQWLKEGKDVLVCSIHRASIPTSWYLYTLLSEARKAAMSSGDGDPKDPQWGQVKYNDYVLNDSTEVQNAAEDIPRHKTAASKSLNLLFDYMAPEILSQTQQSLELLKELKERLPESAMWSSDWYSTVPEGFEVEHLQRPVRYSEKLYPLIKLPVDGLAFSNRLPAKYTYEDSADPQPGPDVIHLLHKGKGGEKWPIDSEKCGRRVAKVLRQIGVGATKTKGDNDPSTGDNHYQYRDVLIITRNVVKRDETPAFARGLEAAGIPTAVFGRGDYLVVEEAFSDVILAPEDKVMVMNNEACIGLDRKVVVCLTGVGTGESWEVTEEEQQQIDADKINAGTVTVGGATVTLTLTMDEQEKEAFKEKLLDAHRAEMETLHRLTVWSRCCRQLIIVHLPEHLEGWQDFRLYRDSSCAIL